MMIRRMAAALAAMVVAVESAEAYFASIVIDGAFDDWTNVPVAVTDSAGDDGGGPDLASLQIANDESNLYLRVVYHAAVNPNGSPGVYLALDNDVAAGTGFDVFGFGLLGSEAGWQNDFPFQQTNGTFNSGTITGGGASIAPYFASTTNQEYAIPLAAVFADGSGPVFPSATNRILVYTDFTPASETMGPVVFTLTPNAAETAFASITLTNVIAFRVTNSLPAVTYRLESAPAPSSTNWVSTGFEAAGNNDTLYLYDAAGHSTTKIYRVIAVY